MSELAQNQIRFRFAARMVARYFQSLQTVIRGTSQ
jgi:flagellar basal body rod protein FlgB